MSRESVAQWLDGIRPGDVVRFLTGSLRTVLEVSRRQDGRVHAARFAIRRCSWTHRGHTIIGRSDLLDRLDCLTRARIRLDAYEVPKRLIEDIKRIRTARGPKDLEPHIRCCDVIGVFE